MNLAYTVIASCPSKQLSDEYIAWLEDGHIDAVIAGGAHSAMIVRLDRDDPAGPWVLEVRYMFSTRAAFDRYVKEHAPALRADGLKRFGPERGFSFKRTIGEVI